MPLPARLPEPDLGRGRSGCTSSTCTGSPRRRSRRRRGSSPTRLAPVGIPLHCPGFQRAGLLDADDDADDRADRGRDPRPVARSGRADRVQPRRFRRMARRRPGRHGRAAGLDDALDSSRPARTGVRLRGEPAARHARRGRSMARWRDDGLAHLLPPRLRRAARQVHYALVRGCAPLSIRIGAGDAADADLPGHARRGRSTPTW